MHSVNKDKTRIEDAETKIETKKRQDTHRRCKDKKKRDKMHTVFV
jgi:hypothetical protein